ncbi:hypothetical protein PIB30_031278 [Stylosanthes scabra]|uniref:Uncharacterized protein n=1 Tax=Stylosanthes scabra TaxID=79078 RepID=A0ABU6YC21_9FABA|nr:hypothetical protein [Stylosanthes scabra]
MVTGEAAEHSRICQQVGQPGIPAMAPFIEGFYCMCALVVGQRRPSLDVSVVVQYGREEDHRHSQILIGCQQSGRDQQEGRLLYWRSRLDRVTLDDVLKCNLANFNPLLSSFAGLRTSLRGCRPLSRIGCGHMARYTHGDQQCLWCTSTLCTCITLTG